MFIIKQLRVDMETWGFPWTVEGAHGGSRQHHLGGALPGDGALTQCPSPAPVLAAPSPETLRFLHG